MNIAEGISEMVVTAGEFLNTTLKTDNNVKRDLQEGQTPR